ncbi:MFS transporter [Streptomyces hygroscopicus]|uniref:MFS transporter n=1 Tax=Streptomyces hygroscopicus TaxID=1912 RepID=UPI003690B712
MNTSPAPQVHDNNGDDQDGHGYGGKKAAVLTVTLILGVLSYQLNASMLSPALPDMARDMDVSVSSISQISSVFFLFGSVAGMIFTRWSDYLGRRRTLLVVLAVLTAGTLLCLFAPNLQVLLVGRALQGASNATFNFAYLLLSKHLKPRLFGLGVGFVSAINGGAGGVDGYLGGVMADNLGFQSIFLVILVLGLIAMAASWRVIPRDSAPLPNGRMDWWGALLMAFALVCLSEAISEGSARGWTDATALVWCVGAVVAIVAFWAFERRKDNALVPLSHLASRHIWPVLLATVLSLASVFATITFSVVIIAEDSTAGFGLSASTTALMFLTPAALLGAIAAPVAGSIAGRHSWLMTLRVGMVASLLLLAGVALSHSHQWIVFVLVAALGLTFNGIVLTSLNGLSVVQSPPDAPALLPGLNGSSFGIGASLGIAVVAPFIGQGTASGFATGLWIAVGIALVALAISSLIRPRPVTAQ